MNKKNQKKQPRLKYGTIEQPDEINSTNRLVYERFPWKYHEDTLAEIFEFPDISEKSLSNFESDLGIFSAQTLLENPA